MFAMFLTYFIDSDLITEYKISMLDFLFKESYLYFTTERKNLDCEL